ncbi:geranylgeranylglyceryl phosphate synthase [candidate division MSBL1 archaeon SCGC-AAA261C02]|uniref:Geranylgeranylglyceryl phosphate synthase n=1 Tax=candidate division MSBL1 archaeon SCGC-AAA261C02 TaxID=1698272 RepID=A0A133V0D1_9EURY|nr:geranylgeranylglyceryl phosphate synthase [candidate division MSBL1 archaeon SCGC-AAA261C02]
MNVKDYLEKIISEDGAAHLTLIDPAEQDPSTAAKMASSAVNAGTDAIMVGGSSQVGEDVLDETILKIKNEVELPIILFPASEAGVSEHADAIFFMSLLNSTDPYFITGAQRLGAPLVKKFGIEPLPMAYLIIEPGGTVGKVGKADLIPRNKPEIASNYALAARYFGMNIVYLEAGSGADKPVPPEMIEDVKKTSGLTLIIGGGIKTSTEAKELVKAGADILVTGTLIEESGDLEKEVKNIIQAIK